MVKGVLAKMLGLQNNITVLVVVNVSKWSGEPSFTDVY